MCFGLHKGEVCRLSLNSSQEREQHIASFASSTGVRVDGKIYTCFIFVVPNFSFGPYPFPAKICLDGAFSVFHRLLHMGMGQLTTNRAYVLFKLLIISRRLLPHCHMQRMVDSKALFARKFHRDDPVLDKIDQELLFRGKNMLVHGGWCIGSREDGSDPCSVVGSTTVLKPTAGAEKLENLMTSLLSNDIFRSRQCK